MEANEIQTLETLAKNLTLLATNGTVTATEAKIKSMQVEKDIKVIIRGLRAVSDYEYEMQIAQMNRNLNKSVETIFLMTNTRYSFLSSSVVKEVAKFGGDISEIVPKIVEEKLKKVFREG